MIPPVVAFDRARDGEQPPGRGRHVAHRLHDLVQKRRAAGDERGGERGGERCVDSPADDERQPDEQRAKERSHQKFADMKDAEGGHDERQPRRTDRNLDRWIA